MEKVYVLIVKGHEKGSSPWIYGVYSSKAKCLDALNSVVYSFDFEAITVRTYEVE